MDAEVGVGNPLALLVHAEEALVLLEQTTWQQLPHRMEFVLHLESEPMALLKELLPIVSPDEVQDWLGNGCRAMVVKPACLARSCQSPSVTSLGVITTPRVLKKGSPGTVWQAWLRLHHPEHAQPSRRQD